MTAEQLTASFSRPKFVDTRSGTRQLRTMLLPSEHPVWNAYRENKKAVRDARFSIGKSYTGEGWEIAHWQTVAGQFEADIETLASLLISAKQAEEQAREAMRIDYVAEDYEPLMTDAAAKLYDWQRPSCQRLVEALRKGNALDASMTGTGKSFVALAACAELDLTPFIVAPLAVLESWKRASKFMGVPIGDLTNWDRARAGSCGFIAKDKAAAKKAKERAFSFRTNGHTDLLIQSGAKPVLVFDEIQNAKSDKSLQARVVIDTVRQGQKCLGLSATAAKDPTEMRAVGLMLGLHQNDESFRNWMKANGCKSGTGGYYFTKNTKAAADIMQRLHRTIFPIKGTRIRSTDAPGYPENNVEAQLIDNGEIVKAYDAMQLRLKEIETKRKANEIDSRNAKASGLAAIMAARRASELGKLDYMIEQTRELAADGFQVACFLNFREHLKIYRDALKLRNDPVWGTVWLRKEAYLDEWGNERWRDIDGPAQKPEQRTQIIDDFQSGKEKVIPVSLMAGGAGISLHDDRGIAPRQSLISPSYSAIGIVQAIGRIWRAGSHSKATQRVCLASGTIEEDIAISLTAKIKNIETLNDGDLNADCLAHYVCPESLQE